VVPARRVDGLVKLVREFEAELLERLAEGAAGSCSGVAKGSIPIEEDRGWGQLTIIARFDSPLRR
jgi:hypothetical protein